MQKRDKAGLLFDRFKIVEKCEETALLKTYVATDETGQYKVRT